MGPFRAGEFERLVLVIKLVETPHAVFGVGVVAVRGVAHKLISHGHRRGGFVDPNILRDRGPPARIP